MTTLVVDAAAALVGEDLDLLEDARVVIEEGVIRAAGARGQIDIPARSEVIDEGDSLLLPGFVDAHVHVGFADPVEILTGGVTAVRDLGSPPHLIWPLAGASTASDFEGPLVVAAGQMLTAPSGYPLRAAWAPEGTGRAVGTPEDAALAVDDQTRSGANVIKIALNPPAGPVLSDECLAAIVGEAHRRGLKVTGHVYGTDQLERALDAGVDELAHMLMSPDVIPDALIEHMADAGMVVVPTLSCRFDDLDVAVDNTERFRRAGGTIVYGTDLGNEGPRPGIDPREVTALARAGMSSPDVVRAATVTAAAWLGLSTKGAIAAGRDADLLTVPAAALDDTTLLTQVLTVWRAGHRRPGRAARDFR